MGYRLPVTDSLDLSLGFSFKPKCDEKYELIFRYKIYQLRHNNFKKEKRRTLIKYDLFNNF